MMADITDPQVTVKCSWAYSLRYQMLPGLPRAALPGCAAPLYVLTTKPGDPKQAQRGPLGRFAEGKTSQRGVDIKHVLKHI